MTAGIGIVDTSDIFAAHKAQYCDLAEVRAAGKAWFEVDDLQGRNERDRRRLKARYEKVIAGARAAPDQQEADPP